MGPDAGAPTASRGLRGPDNDQAGQSPIRQPLYIGWPKLGEIWHSDDSLGNKLDKTWNWWPSAIPEGGQGNAGQQRLDTIESSPLGAVGYGIANLFGGSERTQGLALDAGAAADGLLTSAAALQSQVPRFTGAVRPPTSGLPAQAPTTANAEVPYGGRPATPPATQVGIKAKGAALEAAATLSALRRGAVKLFNAKHGNDNGFDRPYLMRDETGYPQLHNDVIKAYSGDVPVTGKGSPTEIGTNKVGTRIKNERVLADRIASTPTDDNFTDVDKKIALKQLERGDVVTNLVGKPGTRFSQGHIDFINNKTPYKMGEIRTLDPIVPIFDGDSYGTSSIYVSNPPWEKK